MKVPYSNFKHLQISENFQQHVKKTNITNQFIVYMGNSSILRHNPDEGKMAENVWLIIKFGDVF